MAYKSKFMQERAGEYQPTSAENKEYKSSFMRNYENYKAQRAQQEEAERQQALLAQQEAEAPRRATLRDLTLGSIGKGYATSRYGNERYDEIMLGTQRQAKQAQKAKEKLEQEKYNFEAKSKAGQAISGAGELLGQIAYNLTNKDTLGAVGANVAGASAVGAVVPLPEELVTIPVAVGRGLKMGSAATSFQVSAAQAYDEMLEAGVSPKTAKTVANVIGGGVAALDAMQVDELAKSFKLAKNAKTEAGEKAAANIAKALAKVGKSTAIETGQEVAQEAVTMVGQDVAKRQEGIKTFSGEEYKQRLGDTAVQSALSFGLLGGLGAVGGAVANRNNLNTQTNDANRAINEAENTPKRAINSKEDGSDTNVVTTQPEIAPETAVAEDATKLSLQGKTKQNATNTLSRKRYGEEGKKAFKAVKNDPAKTAEFDKFYQEGLLNKQRPTETVLSKNEATAAYMAGMKDGQTNRTAYAQKQYVTNKEAGLDKKSAENVSLGDRIVYNTIGKAFGKKVVIVPTLKNADGTQSNAKIDLANGIIYIAQDAQNGGRVALAHEVVHDMRVAAPAEFDNLARLVTDYHKKFSKYDSKFADTAKLYELDKGKIDYYDMMEEMVADFIADNKGAERIVDMLSTDKTLAQKFIDSVKKVVVQLGKLALDKETRKIVNEWEDLVKQLEKAVKATEQKVKAETSNKQKASDNQETKTERFSLKNPVEQTKDLIAVHNLDENNLLSTIELGGFPMPSIAILKAEHGHSKYGDISVVFGKKTIDPLRNEVYGGDAWTPTFPKVEYKIKPKAEKKLRDMYYDMADKYGYNNVKPLYSYMTQIEDKLNQAGSEKALLERIYDDAEIMQVYLDETGKGRVKPIVEETKKEMSEGDKTLSKWLINDLGEDVVKEFVETPKYESTVDHHKKWFEKYGDKLKTSWEKYCKEVLKANEEQVQNIVRDTKRLQYGVFVNKAGGYLKNKGVTTERKVDYDATDKAIREKAKDGYKQWVDSLFKDIVEKTGLRNNKDTFTASGNRRSWNALHWENTLENIVKAMAEQNQKGAVSVVPSQRIHAVAQKQYNSIEEIKADSNRLRMMDDDAYNELKKEHTRKIVDIASSIAETSSSIYGGMEAMDDAAELIVDAISKYKTKSAVFNYMRKYNKKVTLKTVDDIFALVNDIANMPTGYFEAKPTRAVGLDEVEAVIIPSSISEETKQKIKEVGMPIVEYDGTEQDRLAKLNSLENVRFSKMSANKKITVGMTDSERTDILKTKSIVAEVYEGQADKEIDERKAKLESNVASLIKTALVEIGEQFGVFTNYSIKDVELEIKFSRENLRESISKKDDARRGTSQKLSATEMAKLIPIFEATVKNAVAIETHANRYFYNDNILRFDNLVGGYVDGDNFIPVRYGLKHCKGEKPVLYIVIDQEKIPLNKIKAEVLGVPPSHKVTDIFPLSAYTIKITDFVPFVNGKDLLRYIPDDMLNADQKKVKWEGIAETIKKTNEKNDSHYTKYISKGNLASAKRMVKNAAEYYGYTIEAWHGTRQTFNSFSKDKLGSNTRTESSKKWFFAGDKDTAKSYYPYGVIKELQGVEAADKMRDDVKGNLYHLFIKMENPLIVDVAGYDYAAHREKADAFMEYVEQAERNGNDGIILHHVRDNQLNPSAEESTIYLFKEPSQAKSADIITYDDNDNIIPISQRFNENEEDMRYSRKSEPNIPEGYEERGFAESTRTKTTYDDVVKQEFIDNPEIYKQLANKTTIEKARAIMDKGLAFAETEFPKLLERMDATAIALGDMMAREYSNMGEYDKAVTTIRDMAKQLTKAGQFSQAAVIALTKKNPMTALAYAKRDIDKLNADGHKQFGKKWKDFEITAEEEQMFKNIKQGDEDAIKAAYEKINKRIAREYPSTIWQKFIEASRISMLLNPRTNVKNVVSNLLLYPVTRGSGILSSKLQKVYAYYNKDYKPNQSGLLKKDIRKQAEGVWDKVKDTFDTTSKYNEGIKANKRDIVVFKEGMGTRVMENIAPGTLHKLNTLMNTDDAGLMETLRHATYWLLEYGDNIFVKQNFISRLGSYMQAKGITDINTMSEEDMAAAIEVAYREALRATFKDDTALSKWMASIKHTGNPYIDAMMEMIMPFTKTPANIAMRGIDYSPVGLINTITKAKKGADASEVIDELSKNLFGTALIAFGAWLFGKGIVTGGEPENEKEAAFLKQQGWQPYAVMTPNGYVTYDWAQPAAIPIIMGVTIMESLEEGRLGVVDAVKNAGVASFNQWVELSPLQSLKEVMGGYGTVGENLLNTAIEMPQRLIPSALGATARTADTTQRLTYSKGNVAQTQKDLAKSKIPGLSQTLPAAYDTWGREKKRDDSTGLAAFNQFINPSSYKGVNATEADREINRLYNELGDSAVYPRKASYSIEKGGKTYTLSNAEYSEYQRIMGQLSYDGVKALMAKPAYDELTDYEKAEIIKDIYDNAFEKAKYTIMEGQGYKKTEEDIRTAKETKIKQTYLQATPENIAEYYIAYYILNNADSDKTASGTTIAGSKKKNGINRLVELGYSRAEAQRLYDRMKG